MTHQTDNTPLYGPFAETTPTGQSGWIDEARQPIAERVRSMLESLDGKSRFTYSIWRGDDPRSIVATPRKYNHSFIQAAGSRQAMTVEIRITGEDEQMHLYVVGRAEQSSEATTPTPISAERAVRVHDNELFTARESAKLFVEFYEDETVPGSYTLRELDMSQDQSEPR